VKPMAASSLALALAACAAPSHPVGMTGHPLGMREARLFDFNFNLPRDEQRACDHLGQNGKDSGKPVDCDRLSEPEYYNGTWLVDRETSYYSFKGERACWDDHSDTVKCAELEMTEEQQSKIPALRECTKKYGLEFIGRHTVRPVRSAGGYPIYVVVVDRIISAKLLGSAEPAVNICGSD